MSHLTTHILNTTSGQPAQEVSVQLYHQEGGSWQDLASGTTNADGRIPALLEKDILLEPGIYKLKFEIGSYFLKQGVESFYPFIEIIFYIKDTSHYHVPLLLNPFGYSTYRGS